MKKYLLIAALGMAATSAWAVSELSVEVGYGFGGTSSSGKYTAAPDTSFVIISNTGTTPFEGVLSLTGLSGIGVFGHVDVDDSSGVFLDPGETWTLLGGPEGSNYGGYNKCQPVVPPLFGQDPAGPPDNGML